VRSCAPTATSSATALCGRELGPTGC
jgi:hypothetical protein